MNRQKEFTEEGRYTPISKAEGGSSKTYKVVWRFESETPTKVELKTTEVDPIGIVYTNDTTLYDEDVVAVTRGEEEPSTLFDTCFTVIARGGSVVWVDEFDGQDGVYPLYLQITGDE